jgi:hypothetical protein
LTVGSEVDGDYYARTSERPQVFKIGSSLYERLNTKPAGLRSKQIVEVKEDEINQVQIKNPNLKMVVERNNDGDWVVKEPSEKKDKSFGSWRVFSPLESKAEEVIDAPSSAVRAKLARPAVELRLTTKDGKTTVVKVSEADGDAVYIAVEGRPSVYRVGKDFLERLSFKLDEAVTD